MSPATDNQIAKRLDSFLPPAFEILPRLLLLLEDPEADFEALAKHIRVDGGLTADVLRVANSAHFAGTNRAETLQAAVIRLGLRELHKITMKIVASPILGNSADPLLSRLDLWRHSLAVAVGAEAIARRTGHDAEVAFTAGLLHDIGKTFLAQTRGQEYAECVEVWAKGEQSCWRIERAVLRLDHAVVGATLLARWNFPAKVVNAIAYHHEPGRSFPTDRGLTAITHVANTLAYRLGHSFACPTESANVELAATETLGLSPEDLEKLQEEIEVALEREREVFGLSP